MKLKVAQKVSIALSALALVALLIQALVQFRQELGRSREDADDDGRAFGASLAQRAQRVFDRAGLDTAMQDGTLAGDASGVLSRLVLLPDPSLPVAAAAELASGRSTSWPVGTDRLTVAVPLSLGDRPAAVLVQQNLTVREGHVFNLGLLVLGVATVLTAGSFVLARMAGHALVARPISELQAMARAVGEGDAGARVSIRSRDEFEELGTSLNEMAEALQRAREELVRETQARIDALERLRHADRLATVGKLAAGVAHELGTPLNVVLGRARMISTGEVTGADACASAKIIAERADAMARLIRQLLDYARRKSTGKAQLDARALLTSTAELLKPMAHKRGMKLTVAPGPSLVLPGEFAALQQLLSNLVVNALQAMSEGGEVILSCEARAMTPPVELGLSPGRFACLEVRDTGPGIAYEVRRHLFEPFFTTKDVGEGTGLGLAISWGIARDHEGWIDVESEAGRGTTFVLSLPLEAPAGTEAASRR